jgi:hypothetical protein
MFVDATDGFTPETGLTSGTVDDLKIVKFGATVAVDISGTSVLVHLSNGLYTMSLSATDTDTIGLLTLIVVDTSVCRPMVFYFHVLPQDVYDFFVTGTGNLPADSVDAAAIANGAIDSATFASGAINATAIATGAIESDAFAAGAIDAAAIAAAALTADKIASSAFTAAKFATDAITADKIAADAIGSSELALSAVDEIVDGVWDELAAGHVAPGSMGALQGSLNAAAVADAVWDELVAAHALPGSFGEFMDLVKIQADKIDATAITSPVANSLADRVDNVSQEVIIITNISGTQLYIEVALERLGIIDLTTTSAQVQFFDQAGNLIHTIVAGTFGAPNGRGIFSATWDPHQLSGGNVYQVLVTIDGSIQTTKQIKVFAG